MRNEDTPCFHPSPLFKRLSHLPKFRKTSFAWIAGQSFTRNGMAMYTPSSQMISLRNRNQNPCRLWKRRRKERPECSRNLQSSHHNHPCAWWIQKPIHLFFKQKKLEGVYGASAGWEKQKPPNHQLISQPRDTEQKLPSTTRCNRDFFCWFYRLQHL